MKKELITMATAPIDMALAPIRLPLELHFKMEEKMDNEPKSVKNYLLYLGSWALSAGTTTLYAGITAQGIAELLK